MNKKTLLFYLNLLVVINPFYCKACFDKNFDSEETFNQYSNHPNSPQYAFKYDKNLYDITKKLESEWDLPLLANNIQRSPLITAIKNQLPLCNRANFDDKERAIKCLYKNIPAFFSSLEYKIDERGKEKQEECFFHQGIKITKVTDGYAGSSVWLIRENDPHHNLIAALKVFDEGKVVTHKGQEVLLTDLGVLELVNSLVAASLNPAPSELKMARILAASKHKSHGISEDNSDKEVGSAEEKKEDEKPADPQPFFSISIISEGAMGNSIQSFIENALKSNAMDSPIKDILESAAQYLAKFHYKFHDKFFPKDEERRKELFFRYRKDNVPSQCQGLKNFATFLPTLPKKFIIKREHYPFIPKKYKSLATYITSILEKYDSNNTADLTSDYLLTMVHGDMHVGNIFYNSRIDNGESNAFSKDYKKITIIDYETMMRTYGPIGDPAQDTGRFLGSLWSCGAEALVGSKNLKNEIFEKIFSWQKTFMDAYLLEASLSPQAEKVFCNNTKFYKIRFYKIKFTDNKGNLNISNALHILWMLDLNKDYEEKKMKVI